MYNTISSNTIKQTFKEDDIEFNYLHCKQCDLLLGASFLIKNNLNIKSKCPKIPMK